MGTIVAATGLYTAPGAAGTATVQASSGAIAGTASVTRLAPPITTIGATVAFSVVSALEHWVPGQRHDHQHGQRPRSPPGILQFNFAATITQIWNATIASHSGKQYLLENAGYNSTIAPGQSVSFGFLGSPGGVPAAPTNYIVNGTPISTARIVAEAHHQEKRPHPKPHHNRHRGLADHRRGKV